MMESLESGFSAFAMAGEIRASVKANTLSISSETNFILAITLHNRHGSTCLIDEYCFGKTENQWNALVFI